MFYNHYHFIFISLITLQGSMNVHRGALLLVPKWRCISSFVFYIHEIVKSFVLFLIILHFFHRHKIIYISFTEWPLSKPRRGQLHDNTARHSQYIHWEQSPYHLKYKSCVWVWLFGTLRSIFTPFGCFWCNPGRLPISPWCMLLQNVYRSNIIWLMDGIVCKRNRRSSLICKEFRICGFVLYSK